MTVELVIFQYAKIFSFEVLLKLLKLFGVSSFGKDDLV